MTALNVRSNNAVIVLTDFDATTVLTLLRTLQYRHDELLAANATYGLGLGPNGVANLTSPSTDLLIMRDDVVVVSGELGDSLNLFLYALRYADTGNLLVELGVGVSFWEPLRALWSKIHNVD